MKYRVLHVLPDLVPSGLEKMVAGLVRSLDRTRFETAVVSLYDESANGLEPQLRDCGIPLYHLGKRRGLDIRMYSRFARVLRKFGPDILHSHNYVLRYTYPVGRMTRVPASIHTVHNLAQYEVDLPGRFLQWFAFRHGVSAVTIAGEVDTSFRAIYGCPAAAMIPNGIPVDRYAHPAVSRAEWRQAAGIAPNEFVYLCAARFSVQKDHATLLNAFHKGPARLAHTRLLLAGDGELRRELEGQVKSLGIERQVTFLGRRSDMPETLAAADVFVLASRWEGNPLAVMEAMAACRPVVATSVGAVPELVRDGIDGLLVSPGDASALAQCMSALCIEPAYAREMGRAAGARARQRFEISVMARAYADLYERLIARTQTRAGAAREAVVTTS